MPDIKVKINHGGSQTINAEVKRSLKLKNQDKTITENGNYTADVGYTGLGTVTVDINAGKKYEVTADAFLGDVDENGVLQFPTEQIELDFTGVKDVAINGLSYRFYGLKIKKLSFPDLISVSGKNGIYMLFSENTELTDVSFPKLTTISGQNGLSYTFNKCSALKGISFPSLTTISGSDACGNLFYYCTALTDVSLPSLTTISGSTACANMLKNCTALKTVTFPSLTNITGMGACRYLFANCKAIEDVYFPALTSSSFGTQNVNQFESLLTATSNVVKHTLHFPSNLESTISGLKTYPNFGGTSKFVVLAFDLPATS